MAQRIYQRQGDVRTTRSTKTGDNNPPRLPQGEHRGRRRRYKTMHDAFKKGRSRNTLTHDLITKLFWLQVKEDFTLKLRWVCSEANWAADSLTRPERTEHVRPSQATFDRLWVTWGGVDMDLMATDTSAQSAPIGGGLERQNLPFYSWFHTNNTAGVDVFSHNVSHMPGSLQKCFGYCFPQPSLVGVVLVHICKCQARAVIVVPNTRAVVVSDDRGSRSPFSTNCIPGRGQPVL